MLQLLLICFNWPFSRVIPSYSEGETVRNSCIIFYATGTTVSEYWWAIKSYSV